MVVRADPRCGGIGGGAGGGRGRGLPSQNKAVPRADAAPESVTTLDSATNGRPDRFSTINTSWRECAGCGAQSARVSGSDRATVQAACVPWVSPDGHTDGCTHVQSWHGRSARPMAPPPRSGGGSEPAAAHSLRECRGAMARPRRQLAYLGYPVTPMVAHMLARAVGAADRSTTEKRRRE